MSRRRGSPPTVLGEHTPAEGPEMPALVEAVSTKDLLSIRDLLVEEARHRLRNVSPGLVPGCTMVCAMWSIVLLARTQGADDAENIARCMLHDCLNLLEAA